MQLSFPTPAPHCLSSLTSRKRKPSSLFPQETRSGRISTALVFRNASKRQQWKQTVRKGESRLQGPLGATPVYTEVTLMVHEIPHWSRQQPQSRQPHLRSAVETAKGQCQLGRSSSRRERTDRYKHLCNFTKPIHYSLNSSSSADFCL